MTADWIDLGLITDVLDVLDRHGYARSDNEHATRAICCPALKMPMKAALARPMWG